MSAAIEYSDAGESEYDPESPVYAPYSGYDPCYPADRDDGDESETEYDPESPAYIQRDDNESKEPRYEATSPTYSPCDARLTPEPPVERVWFRMQMLTEADLLTRSLSRWSAYAPNSPRTVGFDRMRGEGDAYLFMDSRCKGMVFCCTPYETSEGYWMPTPKAAQWLDCHLYFDLSPLCDL